MNTLTAAATPSPSPNSAPDGAARSRHAATVAIFFLFGVVALVPAVFFDAIVYEGAFAASPSSRLLRVLVLGPSTFFVVAMFIAGVVVYGFGLAPRSDTFSAGRIFGAALLAWCGYPAAFLGTALVVFSLFSLSIRWPDADNPSGASLLARSLPYVTMVAIAFVGVLFATVLVTVAFAVATRHWPRRAFRAMALFSVAAILCTVPAAILHFRLTVPTSPNFYIVHGLLNDPMRVLFGIAWGVPIIVLVGEPLLGALVGHWFYEAANEWSASYR
jgi:hypothetical protein